MNNFTEACDFIKSILIVTLSEEIGSNEQNGMLLQSEIHLRNINSIIKGTTIDEKDNFEKDNYSCDDYGDEIIAGGWTTWAAWANDIFVEAQEVAHKSNNGTVVNAYYNIEVAKKIKNLLSYLPL